MQQFKPTLNHKLHELKYITKEINSRDQQRARNQALNTTDSYLQSPLNRSNLSFQPFQNERDGCGRLINKFDESFEYNLENSKMISIKKNLRSQIDSQKSFYGSRKFTKAPLQQSLTNLIKSQDHRSLSKIDDTLELPPQHFKQIPAYKNYIQKIDYQQKQQGSAIFLSPSRQDKVKLELDKYYLNHEVINKNCNNIVQLNKSNTVYYLKTEKQTNPSPYDVNWTGVDSNIKGMTSFDGYSSRLPQVKKIKKPLSPINKYNQEANLDFQSLKNKTPIQVQPLNKNQMTQQILKTYNFYKLKTHATNALKMKER